MNNMETERKIATVILYVGAIFSVVAMASYFLVFSRSAGADKFGYVIGYFIPVLFPYYLLYLLRRNITNGFTDGVFFFTTILVVLFGSVMYLGSFSKSASGEYQFAYVVFPLFQTFWVVIALLVSAAARSSKKTKQRPNQRLNRTRAARARAG